MARPMASVLSAMPGPGTSRHPDAAGIGRANGGGGRRNFVLGLEGLDTVLLGHAGQNVQHVGRRRDRIGAIDEFKARKVSAGGKPPADAFRTGDVAVFAWRHLGRRHMIGRCPWGQFHCLAECMSRFKCRDVDFRDVRQFGKLAGEPVPRRARVAVEQPEHQTQGPHVLGAQALLVGDLDIFHRLGGVLGVFRDLQRHDAVPGETAVLERIGFVSGLLEVSFRESVLVDDKEAVFPQVLQIGDEAGRVHGHQNV